MKEQGGVEIKDGKIILHADAARRYDDSDSRTVGAIHARASRLCLLFGVRNIDIVGTRGKRLGTYTYEPEAEFHGAFAWYNDHGIESISWGSYRATIDGCDVTIEKGSTLLWSGTVATSDTIDHPEVDAFEAKCFTEGYLRAVGARELRQFQEMSGRSVLGSVVVVP